MRHYILFLSIILISISCKKKYELQTEVWPINSGRVTPQNGEYKEGEEVTVQASADSGYRFKEWTIDGAEGSVHSTNPFVIDMDGDHSILATFEEEFVEEGVTDYNDEIYPVDLTFEGYLNELSFFERWNGPGNCPELASGHPLGIYGEPNFACLFIEGDMGRTGSIGTDSANPRNYISRRVPITFRMNIRNKRSDGSSVISASSTISTSSPGVTIINNSSGVNNIPYNGSSWTTNDFKILVNYPDEDGTIAFDLSIEEQGESFVTKNIVIPFEPFEIHSISVDDDDNPDSDGNTNGICEFGERIETFITVSNKLNDNIEKVYGLLESSNNLIDVKDQWNGVSNKVDALVWYNYNFDSVNNVVANQEGIKPRFDFVFDYNLPTSDEFSLDLIISGKIPVMGRRVAMRQKLEVRYNQ
ncbi:hypothetical protein N9545_04510 [Salibacteraceae bacterium]|nr:hypothetical protein [Salibacteraceae bacterium]MDB9708818.1 hypothetical protein [Salibacteraceae bacterium]MDC1304962.1 hypothetical protein [Salibacteraceae bacterium]